ncbi:uncharacterized protein EV420DRAFT_1481101 [Desarmillaria tabescens]|uniref:Uncharacterized protein n=1 Tax=Armillaria tabescens TaxID=1929756 RepID=A0AA39K6T4_ARMTA|nr:uncharacterized protein EV420DRAFT_1481101 [Desarmillaria tabescens]KAK0455639.1 hypothetical protein EV420DRAFT_1481101 [Desarmillaria tabescens]
MSTLNITEHVTEMQLQGEPQVALPNPRSLLSISRQPQSLSMTSVTGHFTDMRLSKEPSSVQQAPRSLLSISWMPQNLSMTSVMGHFDDMRLLDKAPIAPLQCEDTGLSSSEVQKKSPTQLVLRCSKAGYQCDWHFFYRYGTPWSVLSRIIWGHHHFCPMPPPDSQPHPSTTYSPRKTRFMAKSRTSDTQKKVRAAKSSKKELKEGPVEDPVQTLPRLRPLSVCPIFPEYELPGNQEIDENMDPQEEERKAKEYEALFRPHCGGPPYILDVGVYDTEDCFEASHQSTSTDPKLLIQEFPLRPAIW